MINVIEEEDRALPEWLIVKREILMSLYYAITELRNIHRTKILGKKNSIAEARFEGWVIDLYLKLKSKIKKKRKKSYKKFQRLLVIDNFINNGSRLGFKNSLKCFYLLEEFVEKLGITDITIKSTDPRHMFKRF